MGIGTINKRIYGGIPLGITIRKQVAKAQIFRVRPGNGYFNAKIGTFYQDQYTYFVPTSITNVEGEPYRVLLASAVSAWKNTLTPAEKAVYNSRANKGLHMSGYNLFIREVILGITSV